MRSIPVLCLLAVLLFSCNKVTYKKTPGGMPYKLYRAGKRQEIKMGNIIKASYSQKINDSVYVNTFLYPPLYIPIREQAKPYDISELWTKLGKGDSLITVQLMDTFIRRNPTNMNPQFRNGDKVVTTLKIYDIFENDSLAAADEKRVKDLWLVNEVNGISSYLKGKNIKAVPTKSGTFVEMIRPGNGAQVDSGKYVTVMYTGTSMSGVRFDSNTDSAFHHTEPLTYMAGTPMMAGGMIKGFDEAVRTLKAGDKVRIYIPSLLGYAGNPPSQEIKPYETIMFDIEVVGVSDSPPPPPSPAH